MPLPPPPLKKKNLKKSKNKEKRIMGKIKNRQTASIKSKTPNKTLYLRKVTQRQNVAWVPILDIPPYHPTFHIME